MEQPFCCPVCGAALTRQGGALQCPARHSFDLAARGYAHLLPSGRMHTKAPGDNREMVAARRAFLDGGFYEPFLQKLSQLVLEPTAGVPQPRVPHRSTSSPFFMVRDTSERVCFAASG